MRQEIYNRAKEMMSGLPEDDLFFYGMTWDDLDPTVFWSDTYEGIEMLADEFNISHEEAYEYMKKAFEDFDFSPYEGKSNLRENKRVRISESRLRDIISESIRKVLKEGK